MRNSSPPTGTDPATSSTSTDSTAADGADTDDVVLLAVSPRSTRSIRPLRMVEPAADEAGLPYGAAIPLVGGPSVEDIARSSTRRLRILANQAFGLLDTDDPPAGTRERYELILTALDDRGRSGVHRYSRPSREAFRDNQVYRRFELFIDGALAVHVKYAQNGARVVLTDGVEYPGFRDQGLEAILMRHIMLSAHKRRLNIVPQCPMAFAFLADNPQYRALAGPPTA